MLSPTVTYWVGAVVLLAVAVELTITELTITLLLETSNKHVQPFDPFEVDPLEKDKLIHVDRDDQRFACGMAVRLETEDPMLHRKDDARELLKVGDVVCGPYATADLDVVVVPLQQSFPIEVQRLLCTVGRDIRGEADFQTTPRFACFLPRLDFFGSTPGLARKNGVFMYVHIAHPAK